LLDSKQGLQINTSTTTNYANVAYELLPYNMESATLTVESNITWRHRRIMYSS